MYKLQIIRKFDAAHYLRNYQGECAHLHGHTWKVVFTFVYYRITDIGSNGIIVDFKDLKKSIDDILPDHKYLNDLFSFNPTAENLAKFFYETMKINNQYVYSVQVWESENSCAEYSEY